MKTIRLIRIARGLSQKAASRKAGIDQCSWSQYETGKHSPNVRTLKKMSKALSCEVIDFFKEIKI